MKLLGVVLGALLYLSCGSAQAQVVLDAVISAPATGSSIATLSTTNLTVGSGTNRALVVELLFEATTAPTSITVTWDSGGTNQAMTQIATKVDVSTTLTAQLWGLVAPTSGAKTLKASWTNSAAAAMGAVSWTGVNQTGGATSFPKSTNANGSTSPATVAVTSVTNNAVMDAVAVAAGGTITAGNQTQVFKSALTALNAAGQRAAGAASVTMSWTLSTGLSWAIVGTNIAAAASSGGGAASTCAPRALLGVGC